MKKTNIEWTDITWNPTTGCTKVSAGCKFCYAEKLSIRLKAMGAKKYLDGFNVRLHPESLLEPYKWKRPMLVFVNSMSDLFHEQIPLDFIKKVFQVMNDNPRHTFQILTKRANRLRELSNELNWTDNIWMGVSVEDSRINVIYRIHCLKQCAAKVKFLSCEPLIGPLPNLDLSNIDWVIVGGESGNNARPIQAEWVIDIQKQCEVAQVAFFFKQWGGSNKKAAGNLLNGKVYQAFPNTAI